MVPMKKSYLFVFLLLTLSWFCTPATACDDTLVMLLTAQNPASEFSQIIRVFTNELSVLGTTLKLGKKENYDQELNKVMNAWLEFSKRYMNNPPEEAKNDLKWAEKTSQTARTIGEIRRLVGEKKIQDAHNQVLELSSHIGAFFEGFGVSNEKQLFIKTSTSLIQLEKWIIQNDRKQCEPLLLQLNASLADYKSYLPEIASASHYEADRLLRLFTEEIATDRSTAELETSLRKLKAAFDELRSHILMREWFPAVNQH